MFQFRVKVLLALYLAGVCALVGRQAWLQYFAGEGNPELVGTSREYARTLGTVRGRILDRTGSDEAALALEVSNYIVLYTPARFNQLDASAAERFIAMGAEIFGVSPVRFRARLAEIDGEIDDILRRNIRAYREAAALLPEDRTLDQQRILDDNFAWQLLKPHTFFETESYNDICRIESRLDRLPAPRGASGQPLPVMSTRANFKRKYPQGRTAGHIVGYMSPIFREDVERLGERYAAEPGKALLGDDEIGRAGLETVYDLLLRGRRGALYRQTFYDDTGRRRNELMEDKTVYPERGATLIANLDLRLQRKAEEALGDRTGSVVMLDVANGEVLALASWPRYDPNTFTRDYVRLRDDPRDPLINQPIQGIYQPGSTFKVLTAMAALREADRIGFLPTRNYHCTGSIQVGNRPVSCHGNRVHGDIDMRRALQVSCNTYFAHFGMLLSGLLRDRAEDFSFGHRTGIDLPAESPGIVKRPEVRADAGMMGFGQGPVAVTSLQMAVMTAAIANGGRVYRPHLITLPGENYLVRDLTQPPYNYNQRMFQRVREGMEDAVNRLGGTGYRTVRSDVVSIAGKTGTAQFTSAPGEHRYHLWFISYAPIENPRVAVAVVVAKQPGYGGEVAGPIAKDLLEYGFGEGLLPPRPIAHPNPPRPIEPETVATGGAEETAVLSGGEPPR